MDLARFNVFEKQAVDYIIDTAKRELQLSNYRSEKPTLKDFASKDGISNGIVKWLLMIDAYNPCFITTELLDDLYFNHMVQYEAVLLALTGISWACGVNFTSNGDKEAIEKHLIQAYSFGTPRHDMVTNEHRKDQYYSRLTNEQELVNCINTHPWFVMVLTIYNYIPDIFVELNTALPVLANMTAGKA